MTGASLRLGPGNYPHIAQQKYFFRHSIFVADTADHKDYRLIWRHFTITWEKILKEKQC